MKWFYDLCKDMDLLEADRKESARYQNPPNMIINNVARLKQWIFLEFSSKWEWLPRQSFMKKDKFEE